MAEIRHCAGSPAGQQYSPRLSRLYITPGPAVLENPIMNDVDTSQKRYSHVCHLFNDLEEQRSMLLPFLQVGLASGEHCVYVAESDSATEVRRVLGEDGIEVDEEVRRGRLEVFDRATWRKPGEFSPIVKTRELLNLSRRPLREFALWRCPPRFTCDDCDGAELVILALALLDAGLHLRYYCRECRRFGDTAYSIADLPFFGDVQVQWADGRKLPAPAEAPPQEEEPEGAGDDKVVDMRRRKGGDGGE